MFCFDLLHGFEKRWILPGQVIGLEIEKTEAIRWFAKPTTR
jgi:hypothetical protein